MDFFAHQDAARKRTGLLIFYFVSAMVLIIGALYVVAAYALASQRIEFGALNGFPLFSPGLLCGVSAVVLAVVMGGSVYKTSQLRGGGATVALNMGAKPVNRHTTDLSERKLLNVVEEMAIAAGVPVPTSFILEEEGINAFAAGFTPSDAVVAVTRGCLKTLTRDELQGVIAHEFSHILNGDMRLNIRLMGIVHGLLVLSLIGYYVLRGTGGRGGMRSSSRKGEGGGGAAVAILVVALSLMVVGYIGVVFGRLIKSAVSRQREFLADASSVQFTRNPRGIAGALRKIGGWSDGSRITTPKAEEASHIFFSNALTNKLTGLFDTHPPLDKRIGRIDPTFKGKFPIVRPLTGEEDSPLTAFAPGIRPDSGVASAAASDASAITAAVGTLSTEHIAAAGALLAGMPAVIAEAVHEPTGAQAVVCLLLLDKNPALCASQMAMVQQSADPTVAAQMQRLMAVRSAIAPSARLPLLDMAVPEVRSLTAGQYTSFRKTIDALIGADGRVDVFEFMLQQVLERHCDSAFGLASNQTSVRFGSVGQVLPQCCGLLSVLAWMGCGGDAVQAAAAFSKACAELDPNSKRPPSIFAKSDANLKALRASLNDLRECSPQVKKRVFGACSACILADKFVGLVEVEVLRAVGAALDCPIPAMTIGAQAA
jgi:Zn-dependent protease with chaperone function